MRIKFERTDHDKVSVLAVSGELDASSHELLEQALADLVRDGHFNIVVDLGEVGAISYMGVGTLLEKVREVRRSCGDLKLAGMKRKARKAFSLVNAANVFEAYETEEDAIKSFSENENPEIESSLAR